MSKLYPECNCQCHPLLEDKDGIIRPKPICDVCGHGEFYEGYEFGQAPNFYDQ